MEDLPRNALTAAISAVSPSEVATIMAGAGGASYWRYYRSLPDIRYVVNLTGRLLSMSGPQLERMNDAGVFELVRSDPPPESVGALAMLYDSPGGLEDIARRFAQQYTMDGQTFLVGYSQGPRTVIESLSTAELKSNGVTYHRETQSNGGSVGLPAGTKVNRVWRRDPERSGLAETPLESLVDDMETLIALNNALRARVKSRLAAAGILFLPNSIVSAAPAEAPDGTGKAIDPVTRAIIEAMSVAMKNADSPEAVMPIVVRGPDEAGALIRHITLDRVIDEQEMRLRAELRENIRNGLDAPKGIGEQNDVPNVNHWNAAATKMEMWEHTVAPIGDVMWESLSRMVLVPWLEKKGVEGVYRWRVDRDSVQIRNNQDEKTRVALDRNLIGPSAARRRLGISEGDAPDDNEYIRSVGVQFGIPELAFYGMTIDGIDLSELDVRRRPGPRRSGDGRDIPADTVSDEPDDRDRRVR